MIGIAALVIGIVLGLVFHPDVPEFGQPYLPIAVVAAHADIEEAVKSQVDRPVPGRCGVRAHWHRYPWAPAPAGPVPAPSDGPCLVRHQRLGKRSVVLRGGDAALGRRDAALTRSVPAPL